LFVRRRVGERLFSGNHQEHRVYAAAKRQVAYASQFLDRDSRAHHGQPKINSRLCSIGQFDPDDWNFPPKPKWVRWKTYKRYEERFERHEAELDAGLEKKLAARLKLFESK
jgi:hypothetical protein